MRSNKIGRYHYLLQGKTYRIYKVDFDNGITSTSVAVDNEPFYLDPEKARKRVYELNGWNYVPRKKK